MGPGPGAALDVAPRRGVARRRLGVRVVGFVQGVGFRPFVHRLAAEHALAGWVENDPAGVSIEVEGDPSRVAAFVRRLQEAPAPARILDVRTHDLPPGGGDGFVIRPSRTGTTLRAGILPDLATCPACRAEVLDPSNRRHRYAFTNCTRCGPRFTILDDLPYDRARTSMRTFALCDACAHEYADPSDRRFHAQPNACPECGPRLSWRAAGAAAAALDDAALHAAEAAVRAGRIVAVKGLGGYHLVVDARNEDAVLELRRRKRRNAKPFAVMMPDQATLEAHVHVTPLARALLESPVAPVLLLDRRPGSCVAPSVAPDMPALGVFLPYTPLHHLLTADLGFPVVATSANRSDEPTIRREDDAAAQLAGIADGFLEHDRPIRRVADDSVVQIVARPRPRAQWLRRARGLAPAPILAGRELPEMLALGAQLNGAFALSRGREVLVSPHLGDLEGWSARENYRGQLRDLLRLSGVRPRAVVHDRHPDYFTTRLAEELAAEWGVPRVAVGHHHAHLASCLLENGAEGTALGITWDGTGYGDDGTVWGGEFLRGDAAAVERVATLHPFRLPGGEQAVRETWRIALALLHEAFDGRLPAGIACLAGRGNDVRVLQGMLARGVASPVTTSVGRLFDGVAALLGLCTRNEYSAHAPQRLEAAARSATTVRCELPLPLAPGPPWRLDWRPLVRALVTEHAAGRDAESLAAAFHRALAGAALEVAARVGEHAVALSGGVFANRVLLEDLLERLEARGFRALTHEQLPPTDGGVAAGQLAVAAARAAAA